MTFEYHAQVKVTVDFSPDLARLSGLRSDMTYVTGEDVISEREPNLSSNIRSVYVYCDLLEHVPVGECGYKTDGARSEVSVRMSRSTRED